MHLDLDPLLIGCLVCFSLFSPHIRGIRIPESTKILLIKFEILGFGIRNTAQGIQNPSSTDKYWNLVLGIRNPQGGIQNPRLYWIPLHGAICLFVCLFVLNRQSRAKTFKHFLNIFKIDFAHRFSLSQLNIVTLPAEPPFVFFLIEKGKRSSATQPCLVSSRNAPRRLWGGALRDNTKNGYIAD